MVFEGMFDPESLEAHACCEAFSLAEDLQMRRVKVATDCMATVNHIKGKFIGISSTIIDDIKERMLKLDEAEVIHEARESNFEAHDLARASVSMAAGRHLWLSTIPDILFLRNVIDP